jgi:hypothetical protein
MAKAPETFAQVVEAEHDKLILITLLDEEQLNEVCNMLEPLSRSWRGKYQSLAKAIVGAYKDWKGKQT